MIKVAIIGAGDISDFHIEAYASYPARCRIVAVADIDAERAERKIARHGLGCPAIRDYRDLVRSGEVDLVSICLPPALHREASVAFLSAGIAVLCEKPMASSLEECDDMLAAAESGRALLSVVAQNRFKSDVSRTRALLASGAVGKPLFVQADSHWWRGDRYYDLWWRGTWEKEGGGCTFIHAVHHIDLLLWMMGEAEEVRASVANVGHANSEVEDLSMASIRFRSGARGLLTASLLRHGEAQRFSVDAEKATVELPHRIAVSRQLENGYPENDGAAQADLEERFRSIPEPNATDHRGQIDDVLGALEDRRAPLIGGADGRRTIEFISAVYQSAFLDLPVALPLSAADPFYTSAGLLERATRFHRKTASLRDLGAARISAGGNL